jgi:hypothetical protein
MFTRGGLRLVYFGKLPQAATVRKVQERKDVSET